MKMRKVYLWECVARFRFRGVIQQNARQFSIVVLSRDIESAVLMALEVEADEIRAGQYETMPVGMLDSIKIRR